MTDQVSCFYISDSDLFDIIEINQHDVLSKLRSMAVFKLAALEVEEQKLNDIVGEALQSFIYDFDINIEPVIPKFNRRRYTQEQKFDLIMETSFQDFFAE